MQFCVTSHGLAATRWLSFALASNPRVFVAHGDHNLHSVIRGSFSSEKDLSAEVSNTRSLVQGQKIKEFLRESSLRRVFDVYRETMPGAVAWGSVHSYTVGELHTKPDLAEMDLEIVNLLRHPVGYIDSHQALMMASIDNSHLNEEYRVFFSQFLKRFKHLRRKSWFRENDLAFQCFACSCLSALNQAEEISLHGPRCITMEELTTDPEALRRFCQGLTGQPYPEEDLSGFVETGRINRHRAVSAPMEPERIYASWQAWKKDAYRAIVPTKSLAVFARVGYHGVGAPSPV